MTTYEEAVAGIRREYEQVRADHQQLQAIASRAISRAPEADRLSLMGMWRFLHAVALHLGEHRGVTERGWRFPYVAEADREVWRKISENATEVRNAIDALANDNDRVTSAGGPSQEGSNPPWDGDAGTRYRRHLQEQRAAAGALADYANLCRIIANGAAQDFKGIVMSLYGAAVAEAGLFAAGFGALKSLAELGWEASRTAIREFLIWAAGVAATALGVGGSELGIFQAVDVFHQNIENGVKELQKLIATNPSLEQWPNPLASFPSVGRVNGRLRIQVPLPATTPR